MMKNIALALMFLSPLVLAETKTVSGYKIDTSSLCNGFPKVNVKTQEGTCMGLVASEADGLKRPRRILSLGNNEFIVTDMAGWVANAGKVFLLDAAKNKLTVIFDKVDHAHGLALGPDGLVYIGTRSSIFRFDPRDPKNTKESVIENLPAEGSHPLTHFIFDQAGNLIINIGAPSDQCLDKSDKPQYPCPQSEGENPGAALRLYSRNSDGTYTKFKVIAKGLRNSMALAIEPNSNQLLQGENSMDFSDAATPLEEINLIKDGAHYGWPYCYENNLLNPKYKRTLLNRNVPKIDCSKYTAPVATLPAHSAPLDMFFYQGKMFPELNGKLVVALHGYRETGHRIVALDLNDQFLPLTNSRNELVSNWAGDNGFTPKGAPVGMTTDEDGNIFFVEDKNKTIMVLSRGDADGRTDTNEVREIKLSSSQATQLEGIQKKIFNQSCVACHSSFGNAPQVLINDLVKSNLVTPGQGADSMIVKRMLNSENGPQMPLGSGAIDEADVQSLIQFIDSL